VVVTFAILFTHVLSVLLNLLLFLRFQLLANDCCWPNCI